MKTSLTIVGLVLLLALHSSLAEEPLDYVYEHTIDTKDGLRFVLRIPFRAVANSPEANPESGHLPLSLSDAIGRARKLLGEKNLHMFRDATLHNVELWFDTNSKRWIYIAWFETPLVFTDDQRPSGGISIPIAVLMNGEVIGPTDDN